MRMTSGIAFAALYLLSAGSPAIEAAEPSVVVDGFVRAFNGKDVKPFGALFTEDADWVNVVGIRLKGRDQIMKGHEEAFATFFKDAILASTASSARMLAPDTAIVHAYWVLKGESGPDGKPRTAQRRGIIQIVAVKQGDDWKIAAGQNTNCISEVPCPTPP